MTFDLHIHGETPEELLDALNHLGGTTNIINASPAPQPQSEPVTQPDKPKAQLPPKPKRPHRSPQRRLRRNRQTLLTRLSKTRMLLRLRNPLLSQHNPQQPPPRRMQAPQPLNSIPPLWTRSATWPGT